MPWFSAASVWITWSIGAPFGADDLPLQRADDAGGDRPVLAERVADRDDRVADLHEVRVRRATSGVSARDASLHLEHGDVGGGIAADDRRRQPLVVREADLDAARALDDVVVRDDVAGLVDDEAGAERLLRLRSAVKPNGSRNGFGCVVTLLVAVTWTTPGAARM